MRKILKSTVRIFLGIIIVIVVALGIYVITWAIQLKSPDRYLPEKPILRVHIPSLGKLATEWLNLEAADLVFSLQNLGELRVLVRDLRNPELTNNPLLRHITEIPFDFTMTQEGVLLGFDLGWRSLLLQPINWLAGILPVENLSAIQSAGNLYFRYQINGSNFYVALQTNIVLMSDHEKTLLDVLRSAASAVSVTAAESRAKAIFRQSASSLNVLADTPVLIRLLSRQNPDVEKLMKNFDLPEESLLSFDLTNEELRFRLATTLRGKVPQAQTVIDYPIQDGGQFSRVPGTVTTWTSINVAGLQELVDVLLAQEPTLAKDFQSAQEATKLFLGISLEDLLFKWTTGEIGLFLLPGSDEPVIVIEVKDQRAYEFAMNALQNSLFLTQSDRFLVDQIPLNQLRLPPILDFLLRLFKVELALPYYTLYDGYLYLSPDPGNIVRSINAILEGNTIDKNQELAGLIQDIDRRSRLLIYFNTRKGVPFLMRDQGILSRVLRLYQKGIASITIHGQDLDVTIHSRRDSGQSVMLLPGFPRQVQGRPTSRLYMVNWEGNRRYFAYAADENRVVLDGVFEESIRSFELPQVRYLVPLTVNRATSRLYGIQRNGEVSAWGSNGELAEGFPLTLPQALQTEPVLLGNDLLFVSNAGQIGLLSTQGKLTTWETRFEDPVSYPPAVREGRVAVYPKIFNGELFVFDAQGRQLEGSPLSTEGLGIASPVWLRYRGQNNLYFATTDGRIFAWGPRLENRGQVAWISGAYQAPPIVLQDRAGEDVMVLLSIQGILSLIAADGSLIRETRIETSADARLAQADLDGDGLEEIVVWGFANKLWVLDQNLRLLAPEGLTGYSEPSYFDLNGDRRLDLITIGLDQQIYAWSFTRP